ncbi:hypothetical protein ASE40_04965 [Flavobacterium sp. Root935]|nr:hypothetical protein ASE40_04965 [Flavobacterium sp. Root935]MDQ1163865.1 hypothetical protein [Flavobacterium sp. SORGH_AS_0622]
MTKMKGILSFIGITLLTVTLFSCNKNEWTPEKEAIFKKDIKQNIQTKEKSILSDKQINYIADCIFEQIKSKNLNQDDTRKPENVEMIKKMEAECAKNSFINTLTNADVAKVWNPEINKLYKATLKNIFLENGLKSEQASVIADCTAYYLMMQNVSLADLNDPNYKDVILKTGTYCSEQLQKTTKMNN